MQDKRTDIVKYQGGLRAVPRHYPLMKVNKVLVWTLLMLMVLVMVAGYYLVPDTGLSSVDKRTGNVRIDEIGLNPAVSSEVAALKGQMIGLVSGSIENKLRTLEESIKLGSTGHTLEAIEDLKNDIKMLRTYSELPKKPEEVVVSNAQLAQEVSHLKKLIYVILVSCGLMLAATAGIWVKYRRLPNREFKSYLDRS